MCTLIGLWRSVPGYDVVVGMNRDESPGRPSDPPSVWEGTPVLVAPRDRLAGGTWIGASGTGLVVGLSNRRGRTSKTARSRGQLVLDALRHDPHPTHFSLSEALAEIGTLKPRRTYLTHLSHSFDHGPTQAALPPHVNLAYDGLHLDF